MKLLDNDGVSKLCNTPLEQNILKSAYSALNDLNDPLRANTFAYLMREVLRIAFDRIASDQSVKDADWIQADPSYLHQGKPTRSARYRFALTGHLSDAVRKKLGLEFTNESKQLLGISGNLNKWTHINTGTFNAGRADIDDLVKEIEDAVIEYAGCLDSVNTTVSKEITQHLQDTLSDMLFDSMPDDLLELSSGTIFDSIDDVYFNGTPDIHSEPWKLKGTASIGVELNYGGGEERDGATIDDCYPMKFRGNFRWADWSIENMHYDVDTSSFYE